MFDKRHKSIQPPSRTALSSHLKLKELGGGRINQRFTGNTSRMSDPDIRNLILKYPPKETGKEMLSLNETISNSRNDKKLKYIFGPIAVVK